MTIRFTRLPALSAPALVLLAFSALSVDGGEKKPVEKMVYELRTYTTAEGRLPALHARFRDHTMQLFKKHGITNVIYWTPAGKRQYLGVVASSPVHAARADSVVSGNRVGHIEHRTRLRTERKNNRLWVCGTRRLCGCVK